ncbi:hypothetical protein CHGG_10966 [Chaetomium globosum CBS 148.51]|uniref:Transcription activator GCR1-like domain-containing protein n=1 Tax=Chaetomium globosum (strain ATCC 6205 / CBS 148.51 / DSM 1962 / NBRC 6347 / NRRL 1970) TaxID=306901 RepID=Q2GM38_CHAGB|nr:uncharacterized protein CHGG_10966 [Chaetomium globosum CBS 148.51]EAQ83148.1 hypothetical protein CHGG_10966 [Chaetomium globosum CBS 148.51]
MIHSMIHEYRPKNTSLAYEPKQREFRDFCYRKQYYDGDTVTEDKLLLFLVEDVANRPLKTKSTKADSDIPLENTRLAWRSVRSYATAITDLYRTQKARGMNVHPSPREDNVREYLKTLQQRDAQQDKDNYADKGRDALLDGYTEEEFERVCYELWARGSASPEYHLRTLVDLLLGHYMLARGGDRRAAELSDLLTFEFTGEGPTRCMPLILTTRAGKQNQHGQLETAGALRNRRPLICMLGGLAFYLLYRWDLTDELLPDFSRRAAWYDIRLLKSYGSDRTAALSYNSQRDWVVKAFGYAGVTSQKKTHVGRSLGAKTAELKGVSEDQIRRAGRWNQEQMVGCYLNALPRKFMRTMAGHPSQMGCFEIRRAGIAPPEALLSMIWPGLDSWKDRFGPRSDQVNDLAAMGLTNLLFYLREVALQDSVLLMQQFPNSPVWNHPVFQHEAYQPFAQQVLAFVQEEEQPSQLAVLVQAMPVLADYLKSIDSRNEARAAKLQAAFKTEVRAAETRLREAQSTQLQTLVSGLQAAATAVLPPAEGGGKSQCTSAQSSINNSRLASPDPARTYNTLEPELQPPQYRMCRAVRTVEGLWREWTVGLRGQPAIAALDSRWGSRWRAGRQSELQWYSLRLEVIKEIRRVAQAKRISEQAAMGIVSMQQQRIGCSLDQFCKQLRANRKACTPGRLAV